MKPLCVDLDGTIVKTDTLLEGAFALLKLNPFKVFYFPGWLLRGKAYFKKQIALHSPLDVSFLPYHVEFVNFLKSEHIAGRRLILATAADEIIAGKIAFYLGCFQDVLASDGRNNLAGRNKLNTLVKLYGPRGFDYAGNALVDLPVWRKANQAILVNATTSLEKQVQNEKLHIVRVFRNKKSVSAFIQAIRVHQWAKNILIFVPLVMAHKITDLALLGTSIISFVAFSLTASGLYLLNDLLDLDADRHHSQKKNRPFASGSLSLWAGLWTAPLFVAGGCVVSLLLPDDFVLIICLYILLTIAYSFWLKKLLLVDVVVLAGLYTIRIIAGAVATGIFLSPWLLGFSIFVFLSLALSKRYSELHQLRQMKELKAEGRDYLASDLEQISSFGSASGYMSVLVLALYLNSSEVIKLYSRPWLLWLICPVLIYWISRIWLLCHRGQIHHDPVIFTLKDKTSYLLGFIIILIMAAAI